VPHHADYWNGFYETRASAAVPDQPSAFASWVAERLEPGQPIIEFGFGNARDTFWFARQGRTLKGFDFAASAVESALARDFEGERPTFAQHDLYDDDDCVRLSLELADLEAPAVYGRFLLHSLEERGRNNLYDLAAVACAGGGTIYLEFRTGHDEGAKHLFGDDHFRVYLDPDEVLGELKSRGASIKDCLTGHGMAVYKTEDPHVARIAATWL